jgi:uncharacterized protein (DUF58 family)
MSIPRRIADWLETHWVTPSYSGWLLFGLAVFFFIAGTNTLAGWLYVLSGVGLALVAIASLLPERTLRGVQIRRPPIHPVSAGDPLTVELIIENLSNHPKSLLQAQDLLPAGLSGEPLPPLPLKSIEAIAPRKAFHWIYCHPTHQRGIYRWQTVQLRTGAPLGLFWCRRSHQAKATAIVYPVVLPLSRCPLIDQIGQDENHLAFSDRHVQAATTGLTRSLRPYRWGDPIRLVHWRTSARYGELRLRELETLNSGQDLVICLDSSNPWDSSSLPLIEQPFEQAVIAAASLYFYACHHNFGVKLWTASTGLIQGNAVVLETLAGVSAGESPLTNALPKQPVIWLTQNPSSISALPLGSRWLLWEQDREQEGDRPSPQSPGNRIHNRQPLQQQLESALLGKP